MFGIYILVFLILVLFQLVLGAVFLALPTGIGSFLSGVVAGTLISPFITLVVTLIYYGLIVVKAGRPHLPLAPPRRRSRRGRREESGRPFAQASLGAVAAEPVTFSAMGPVQVRRDPAQAERPAPHDHARSMSSAAAATPSWSMSRIPGQPLEGALADLDLGGRPVRRRPGPP